MALGGSTGLTDSTGFTGSFGNTGLTEPNGGGSAYVDPSSDTDLISWWDTTDASTITESSGKVSNFNPKAGSSSLALAQSFNARRPITNSRTINGLNVINCISANRNYLITAATFPIPASGNITVMMACAIDEVDSGSDGLFGLAGTNDFQIKVDNATQFDGIVQASGIGPNSAKFSGGPYSGNHIIHARFDFDNLEYIAYIDNVAVIVATDYTTELSLLQKFVAFCSNGESSCLDGAFGDIVITESVDQSGMITNHYNYLSTKFAI